MFVWRESRFKTDWYFFLFLLLRLITLSSPTDLNQEMKVVSSICHHRADSCLLLYDSFVSASTNRLYRLYIDRHTEAWTDGAESSPATSEGHTVDKSSFRRVLTLCQTHSHKLSLSSSPFMFWPTLGPVINVRVIAARLLTSFHRGMWWCLVAAKHWVIARGEGVQDYSFHLGQV